MRLATWNVNSIRAREVSVDRWALDRYRERLRGHFDEAERFCARHGIDYLRTATTVLNAPQYLTGRVLGDTAAAYIRNRLGGKANVESAMTSVEQRPDSDSRKGVLKEELETAGADKDAEVLAEVRRIEVQSTPGQGSRFAFDIPLRTPAECSACAKRPATSARSGPSLSPPPIVWHAAQRVRYRYSPRESNLISLALSIFRFALHFTQ